MAGRIDPNDFLLNTDFEMDKVVIAEEGIINPGETKQISHGLPFTPLMFGCCAFSEDFSDSRSIPFTDDFSVITSSGGSIIKNDVSISVAANESIIEIYYKNNLSNPQPIYYRVFGYQPADSRAKVGATSKYAKVFKLNTDNNYLKLYKSGVVNYGEQIVIQHNFGYIPQVMAWYSYGEFNPGRIEPHTGGTLTSATTLSVSDTAVVIDMSNWSPLLAGAKYYYRIYYDKA